MEQNLFSQILFYQINKDLQKGLNLDYLRNPFSFENKLYFCSLCLFKPVLEMCTHKIRGLRTPNLD